ncbi:MAG: translation initiation inhibitor [Candidatus Muproteobacteria bacterium RBG_16_60_9]|uniref:Translation initiation inhibitor n=1 Tax=Candidatus Muproteobacteria bacterium RBG_16_60_9 TaxID=1817755 RepID=A0A1F6VAK5_9PROT|nr:MAG: translation initiation inhibitor [Candidatus Muproteobacteria bacterium RBG_16_60_9]
MSNKRFIQPTGLSKPVGYTHTVSVERGRMVFIAGQVAFDANNNVVGAGDLRAQTEQVFKNLGIALAAAGASYADVVKWTIYVVNFKPADRAVIAEVRKQFLSINPPPASTLIGVQSLVLPELLIEIEAIAVAE